VAVALLIGRLLLAVAFAVAGAAKLADLAGSRRALEARVKTKGPRLVLVSTGTVEANRASGFRSPVLLDQSFAADRALGVTGTPSAVRVDAEGKIASGIAVGAPPVLELAEPRA